MVDGLVTKVTKINNLWHCRLLKDEKVIDEMACDKKIDIGYCTSQMLRWYDKCGGSSKMAIASRARTQKKAPRGIKGRIWYRVELINMKEKNDLKRT